MNNLIQWPSAKYWTAQWNPVIGCKPCSPACEHCYAASWAKRFGQSFEPHETKQRPPRKGIVFCGNMTDLFGEWVDKEKSIGFVSATQERRGATFLYLTKRVSRMCDTLNHGWVCEKDYHKGEDILPELLGNHYFGFTAENQEWYDKRRDALYHNWPSRANLWISAEPLLGPIDDMKLGNIVAGSRCRWLVVGCESGPNRRPCKVEWVESIVEQCRTAGVPVFVKQLDIGGKCVTDISKFPEHLRIRQVPWATEGGAK